MFFEAHSDFGFLLHDSKRIPVFFEGLAMGKNADSPGLFIAGFTDRPAPRGLRLSRRIPTDRPAPIGR